MTKSFSNSVSIATAAPSRLLINEGSEQCFIYLSLLMLEELCDCQCDAPDDAE